MTKKARSCTNKASRRVIKKKRNNRERRI